MSPLLPFRAFLRGWGARPRISLSRKSPNHEQGILYSDVGEGPFLLDFVDRLDRQTGSGSGELEWERRLRLVIRLTSDRTTMQGVYIS